MENAIVTRGTIKDLGFRKGSAPSSRGSRGVVSRRRGREGMRGEAGSTWTLSRDEYVLRTAAKIERMWGRGAGEDGCTFVEPDDTALYTTHVMNASDASATATVVHDAAHRAVGRLRLHPPPWTHMMRVPRPSRSTVEILDWPPFRRRLAKPCTTPTSRANRCDSHPVAISKAQ